MSENLPNGTWQSWFSTYGRKLMLFARQWASSAADAEDIVQEAFVRFWRSPYRNDADAHVQLFSMVRRSGLDHTRSRVRREDREKHAFVGEDTVAWFAPDGDSAEREREIQAALSNLPSEQREVVVLKIWGELTFDQIGRSLEVSPNTAASRYRYALESMRRQLSPATT